MKSAVSAMNSLADMLVQDTADLIAAYLEVRKATESLCLPLEIDDYNIQTMEDVSPVKWHIAHVSWFFETFVLQRYSPDYHIFHPQYGYLFNSYYETVGAFHSRPRRGMLNRPTVDEIYRYRDHIDHHMCELLDRPQHADSAGIRTRTILGLNHEQQHQELMLTDIKHVFASNPLRPAYHDRELPTGDTLPGLQWLEYEGGLVDTGFAGSGFCFDNELPVHRQYLAPFRLASRLVTNGEFIEFMNDGGYRRGELWLSEAWKTVRQQQWQAPLYWEAIDGQWWHMTLSGMQHVDEHSPACHVSFFEADAYARWADKRLPLETEWELVAREQDISGNLRNSGYLHPVAAGLADSTQQLYGDTWEWTQSPYRPYPGYRPLAGSLGEYNGKFMCNQFVLRGGSCVTPDDHIRASYRNFFYPGDRWQFSGIRLAEDG